MNPVCVLVLLFFKIVLNSFVFAKKNQIAYFKFDNFIQEDQKLITSFLIA